MAAENVLILRSVLALSLILTCASTMGAPVTLYLEGVVTKPNAGIKVSDPLRATFTFESSTKGVPYGNGGTPYTCPPLCEYLDPVTSASVTVGGKTWSLGSAFPGGNKSRIFVSDNAYTAEDILGVGYYVSGSMLDSYRPYYFDFGVTDPTGTRFNGAGLPTRVTVRIPS